MIPNDYKHDDLRVVLPGSVFNMSNNFILCSTPSSAADKGGGGSSMAAADNGSDGALWTDRTTFFSLILFLTCSSLGPKTWDSIGCNFFIFFNKSRLPGYELEISGSDIPF
jgi:hypothetical protein